MLATRDVLAQPADGHNLLLCTHFESINTVLYKNPGFKLTDLAPISLIAKYYYGIALSNSIPAENFEQFLQYAKSRPGRGQLRDARRGLGAGNSGAPAREACRHLDEPRAVPHRLAGDAGPDRGPGAYLRVADACGRRRSTTASSSRFSRSPAPRASRASTTCRPSRRRASTGCATAGSASAREPARRSRSSICSTVTSCRSWRRRSIAT